MRSRLRDSAGIPPTSTHHPGINPHQADSEHDIPHALRNASPAHLPSHWPRFTVVTLHIPAHAATRRGSHLIQHHDCHTPLNETPRTNLAQPKRICRPKRSEHTPPPPCRPHVRRIRNRAHRGQGPHYGPPWQSCTEQPPLPRGVAQPPLPSTIATKTRAR